LARGLSTGLRCRDLAVIDALNPAGRHPGGWDSAAGDEKEKNMKRQALLAAVAVVALSLPAFAATEWYVAQDNKTMKCEVTDKKPDGKTWMMVGTSMYKTKADAEKAMKADKTCK
jgi:hypothetical protein